jgi:hypothetical protein
MFAALTALAIALPSASPPVTATRLALDCVCSTHPDRPRCRAERQADVSETVGELLEITRQYGEAIPESMRMILVAVACGESGIRSRPSCGGDPGCNDSGTSAGMFQIKLSRARGSLRWVYEEENPGKPPLDVYDYRQAGRFYLDRLLWGTSRKGPVKGNCGWRGRTRNQIWSIAAARLGRGPILYWTVPPVGERPRAVQRCTPTSKYAKLARQWWRKCPDCWTHQSPQVAPEGARMRSGARAAGAVRVGRRGP